MAIEGRIYLGGMASACPTGMLCNVGVDGTHYVLARGDASGNNRIQISYCEGLDDQNITIDHDRYRSDIFDEMGLSNGGAPTQGIQIDTVFHVPGTSLVIPMNDRERVGAPGIEVLGIIYSIASPGVANVVGHYRYLLTEEGLDWAGNGGAYGCAVIGSHLYFLDGFGGPTRIAVKLCKLPLATEVDLTAGSWDAKTYFLPTGDMTSTAWWGYSSRDPKNMGTVYPHGTADIGILAYKTTHEGESGSKLWRTVINTTFGTISAFANNGAGGTTVTIASGDDPVADAGIRGTTNYNGTFAVSNVVPGVSFDINATFVGNDATGSFNVSSGKNDISALFSLPFAEEGRDFSGSASIFGDDWYTNPCINVIDANTLEVVWVRGYSDNDGWIGVRRFLCDRDLNVLEAFPLQTFQLTNEVGITFEAGHARREGDDMIFMIRENDALTFKQVTLPVDQDVPVEAEPGADSTIRAWTYTLDGHTFYVLDLGEEGTFKYDKVTGEWSKHITSGYDTQWNVINGTMWGHRIVGGDLIRFDMWEVDPLVLTDNTRGIEFEFATTDVSTGSDTITEATHGLNTGDGPVQFSSTDTLPGGLFSGAGSLYWVIRVDANTLKVASTQLNAYLGTAIDLTSVGVGTHTLTTYDLQIAHAATGGLQGRSRSKVGVGALLVTGSSGTLNNVDGSELRLRWSDNNGASFSNTMTVALTSGGYTTDVSFRSLGSFAAPGRVFELSDTGGPKRLDSAWADIPEIDNVPSR